MPAPGFRIQLLSDEEGIEAIRAAAAEGAIPTEATSTPSSDQRFGIAEVAAIIAIVKTVAEIAELVSKAFKTLHAPKKISIRTPRGSVTIEGDSSLSVAAILQDLEGAGVV